MAESITPSGAEQLRIVKALLHNDKRLNTDRPPITYLASTCWINKWMRHVKCFDKCTYPGKLTMVCDEHIDVDEFCDLQHAINSKSGFTNKWMHEPIWCKWVEWYSVEDGHELTRRMHRGPDYQMWVHLSIHLKNDADTRLGYSTKGFCLSEKCGYIELQFRRIFGVTHDTETQLWLLGKTSMKLDRSEKLRHYTVRYYTVF